MANSINTNISAYYAQANITAATNNTSLSVARLSSGNRIVRSSDDVAALSAGTSLRTNVTTLRTALINASQGSSLLQVADGALSQVTDILQRQKAIAVQAGSGSLDASARSFLDLEFQNLTQEIDRIVSQTNFNGVKLLNGALSSQSAITGATTQASRASATINFLDSIAVGETVSIFGQTVTSIATSGTESGLQFKVGASLAESVNNLATRLNTLADDASYATTLGQAIYTASGTSLTITSRTGGALGSNFVVNLAGTATAVLESSSSGAFKGTYFDIFSVGFSTTNTSVAAASGSVFDSDNNITITVDGASTTLYDIAAGDTLQDIVNGINSNAASTGVTAALTYSQSAATYNIRLFYDNSLQGAFLSLGADYDATTYGINGVQANTTTGEAITATHADRTGGFMFSHYQDVFGTDLTDANITSSTTDIVHATTVAGATPLLAGESLQVTKNGVLSTLVTYNDAGNANTLLDIVERINEGTGTHGYYAVAIDGGSDAAGADWNIRLYYGTPGTDIDVEVGIGAHATAADTAAGGSANTTGATLTQFNKVALSGGKDNGLGFGSTQVTGTVGDSFITSLSQTKARVTVSFPDIADSALTDSANFGTAGAVYLTVGGKVFTFTDTSVASKAPDEITIGSTLKETLDNAVSTINSYLSDGFAAGEVAYQLSQINVSREGNTLVFEGKDIKNVYASDRSTAVAATITGFTGVSASNSGNLNNASSNTSATSSIDSDIYGVDVSGISNADFSGSITGFSAEYTNTANRVDLSVKIGDYTYTAKTVNTNVSSTTTYRFYSDTLANGTNGGYFDIQLKADEGQDVSSQAEADVIADRVNAAFSSLTFLQQRNISSYNGTQSIVSEGAVIGSLLNSSVKAVLPSFSDTSLGNVSVSAPVSASTDGKITFNISGVDYSISNGLGGKLGANQTYTLVSEEDPDYYVEFTTGDETIDFSTSAKAAAFESALRAAFGAGGGSSALKFQVGTTTSDTLSVSINNVDTETLYEGAELNVLTQDAAAEAADAIDAALDTVTSARASVGALQSRFNFASANIQSSIQNQDAARGTLLDTDIAEESTSYATNQVKLQAGISVLAQANQQLQSLLKLIG